MIDNEKPVADGESIPDSVDDGTPEQITEQISTDQQDQKDSVDLRSNEIEASFGPMTVYVSGTDTESVCETFEDVWELMMNTSEKMKEMKDNSVTDNE